MIEGCTQHFDNAHTAGQKVQTIDQDLVEIAHAIRL